MAPETAPSRPSSSSRAAAGEHLSHSDGSAHRAARSLNPRPRRCYPSDTSQSNGANCAVRAKSGLGSSSSYSPSIASMGCKRQLPFCLRGFRRRANAELHADEGGSGYTSGDPSKTRWANWATAYVKYCDGGSMTGTKEDSTPQRNGSSGPLWCKCLPCRLELLPAFSRAQARSPAQTAASTTSTRSWSTWLRRTPSRPSTASSSPAAPPAAWCAPTPTREFSAVKI